MAEDSPKNIDENDWAVQDNAASSDGKNERGALVALLRLLLQEPPVGHDFTKCPICKKYGITRI